MPRFLVKAVTTALTATLFSIVVPVAIWPGEAKLTAPLFCSPPTTEPMVVSDTFHDSEGTSTNYTLYCVGDRGALTDEGFALPMLVLLAAHLLILTALIVLATLTRRARSSLDIDEPTEYSEPEGWR